MRALKTISVCHPNWWPAYQQQQKQIESFLFLSIEKEKEGKKKKKKKSISQSDADKKKALAHSKLKLVNNAYLFQKSSLFQFSIIISITIITD